MSECEVVAEGPYGTWQEFVRATLLHFLMNAEAQGQLVSNLICFLNNSRNQCVISDWYKHPFQVSDITDVLAGMYLEGMLEVSEYKCECCKGKPFPPEEVMKHAARFRLVQTNSGSA